MPDFYNTILKSISDYKVILRRNLSAKQCAAKLHELGIKRNYIKNIDEVKLYETGLRIIDELKKYIDAHKGERTANFYFGAEEFLQYLEELFAQYTVEDGRIIHAGQRASCMLIEAIQLITIPKEKMTAEIVQQIRDFGDVVNKYGSKEQKKIFNDAISSKEEFLASS